MPTPAPAKEMASTVAGRGGGAPGGGHGGGGGSSGNGGNSGCILQGLYAFYCKKYYFVWYFMMCGGNWQGLTSPHTLVMLEVCRHTFV